MARPKGSKNKAKVEATQDAPAAGHNDLTDDQKQALLLQGVGKIEKLEAQKASLIADIRNERKRLKADGFAKEEVDYALWLRKSDDGEASARIEMQIRIARWTGHALGYQAELFGDGVDRTPSVDRAYVEGKVAGMAGESAVLPQKWGPGSEQADKWMSGWHAGQEVLLSGGIKPLPDDDNDLAGDAAFDDATSASPSMRNRRPPGGLGDAPQRAPIQ